MPWKLKRFQWRLHVSYFFYIAWCYETLEICHRFLKCVRFVVFDQISLNKINRSFFVVQTKKRLPEFILMMTSTSLKKNRVRTFSTAKMRLSLFHSQKKLLAVEVFWSRHSQKKLLAVEVFWVTKKWLWKKWNLILAVESVRTEKKP